MNNPWKGKVSTATLSLLAAGLIVVATGYAATTISTNILTGGTLDVTGQTTLTTGSSTGFTATNFFSTNGLFAGTLGVTGQTTLTTASSTGLTATSLYSTNGLFSGTLGITGKTTMTTASSTGLTATALYATTATLTSASTTNSSTTNQTLFGAYHDSVQSKGTSGQLLWSTGTSTLWVATSTLGMTGAPLNSPAFTGNPSYSGTISDLSTSVQTPATSGATITIADNISSLHITGGATIYNLTINMPANPVDGQFLTISTAAATPIYRLTHGGNGKTISRAMTGMMAQTAVTYRYKASITTWILVTEPTRLGEYSTGNTTVMHYEDGTGGIRYDWLGSWSWSIYFTNGRILNQATADGQSTRTGNIAFQTDNTLDVTNSAATNGQYAYSGYVADTYNSSSAYAGGQTNNAQLNLYLANVGQKFAGGNNVPSWTGAAAGIAHYLSFNNAPFRFGVQGSSGFQVFEVGQTDGNFQLFRGYANKSEQRDTGTASFTVTDNLSNVILAGSGTITVTLPAAPIDGQEVNIMLETAYTGITIAANSGQTIVAGATMGVTAGSFAKYRYRTANTKWYRAG